MAIKIDSLILAFVAVVIGVSLIGPLQDIATNSNVTGIAGTIVSLVPLFFAIGIVLASVKSMTSGN